MIYSPEDWLLMLVDNENSFAAEQGRPAYLKDIELTVGEQWRTALLEIDDETLATNLGDVLDKRRITALAKRRDALLDDSNRSE